MKKQLLYYIALTMMLVLSACHSDKFRIEARIDGIGTQNVQIIYATSEGVVSDWVTASDDRISYEGFASELTVVNVLSDGGDLIARLALKNGDDVKFRGAFNDPFNVQFKGSDITEQWQKFTQDHFEEISTSNQPMLDIAIEKFVRENPDNVVSTLLLLYDYGSLRNTKAIDEMLDKIDDKAKPLSLLQTYQTLRNEQNQTQSNHFYLIDLYNSNGKWSTLRKLSNGYNILWLWSRSDENRYAIVDSLKQLSKTYGKRLKIVDICIDGDTVTWHNVLRNDSTNWEHYWAPGGPESKYMTSIVTYTSPTYMLIDSFGAYNYRGASIAEMGKIIKQNQGKKNTFKPKKSREK